jgi:hypothetical protein
MRRSSIILADTIARRRWTYLADPVGHDTWISHADEALNGIPWRGDCDDLAETVLDLLGRGGQALDKRWRLFADTDGDGKVDHLMGCAEDDAGTFWIVGDTGCSASIAPSDYTIIEYHRLDQFRPDGSPDVRGGTPWVSKA